MQIKKYKNYFLYKNKKGDIGISLSELIGALLGVIIISVIFYVGLKLSGIFLSNKDYESTIKSFELLGERVDELVKDKNYANTNLLYFLDKSYILVGFNYKDPSIQIETCKKDKIISLCDKACLCIYKDDSWIGSDFDNSVPLQCKNFDKNIVFLAPSEQKKIFCGIETGWNPNVYSDYYHTGGGYMFLVLYGFDTKEIYLDKYESADGNIFIFLAEYKDDPNDPIYKRKTLIEEKYEKK